MADDVKPMTADHFETITGGSERRHGYGMTSPPNLDEILVALRQRELFLQMIKGSGGVYTVASPFGIQCSAGKWRATKLSSIPPFTESREFVDILDAIQAARALKLEAEQEKPNE